MKIEHKIDRILKWLKQQKGYGYAREDCSLLTWRGTLERISQAEGDNAMIEEIYKQVLKMDITDKQGKELNVRLEERIEFTESLK